MLLHGALGADATEHKDGTVAPTPEAGLSGSAHAMRPWDATQSPEEQGAAAYDLSVGHEHGKVGEVAAGTGGVGLVGLHQAAALGGPVA